MSLHLHPVTILRASQEQLQVASAAPHSPSPILPVNPDWGWEPQHVFLGLPLTSWAMGWAVKNRVSRCGLCDREPSLKTHLGFSLGRSHFACICLRYPVREGKIFAGLLQNLSENQFVCLWLVCCCSFWYLWIKVAVLGCFCFCFCFFSKREIFGNWDFNI